MTKRPNLLTWLEDFVA